MNRLMLALLLFPLFFASAHAESAISAKDAQRDLRILKRGLTDLHPGLYRYTTAEQLDAEFDAAQKAVATGTDRATMFLLASRIAASIRCGHTWTNPLNQSDTVTHELFERADKLPVTLRLVQGRFVIDGSAVKGLDAGSELLSIDGRSPTEVVSELLPYLRADGSSDGKRRAQIDHGENGGMMDRLFPLLHPPVDGHYRLRIRDRHGERMLSVKPTSLAARSKALAAAGIIEPSTEWSLSITGDTAVLTLPTFAFWNETFDWKRNLGDTFSELDRRSVRFLIIDIRRNEGGDDRIGKALLSYLLKAPYTQPQYRSESAYERVPYILARYLDTWDFGFFDRTGEVVHGSGRNWVLRKQPPAETIMPAPIPFHGRALVVIGPDNSSAGYLLARDIKTSGAATLVGETTGGNLRGLNGGQLAWLTLPASGVAVDIPLIAGISLTDQPDAGISPDNPVSQRFEDAANGIDTTMEFARHLIETWRAKPHKETSEATPPQQRRIRGCDLPFHAFQPQPQHAPLLA